MLLSSMAEAMYWCGRYVARAQGLSRVVSSYERLRLDLPAARPLDLRPLLALTTEPGVEKTPESRGGQLQALVFDEQNPSSVLGALAAARENLRAARGVAPPELWHVLNRCYARLGDARGRSETMVLDALEDTLAAIERFEGERAGGMTRDAAYAFLTMGCQIERADVLLRTLGVLLPLLYLDGWERAFDDVRWAGLLDALGETSAYRRRHHLWADLPALLALLLVDSDSPRSLAFCLHAVARQLQRLPHASRVRAAVAMAERDGAALARAPSGRLEPDLQLALSSLWGLHDAVQSSYFPSGEAPSVELPSSRKPSGAPSDPFAYLGREHERAEWLLRVLDEIGIQAARGAEVDRADLAAVVGLLTDFGELNHHEKEESILMPELVAGGFDWYDGPLAIMRREHQQEHYFVRTLSHFASQHEAWSTETTQSFVGTVRDFGHFMRAHMDHERRDLFEQASRALSGETKARLLTAFVDFDAKRQQVAGSGPSLPDLLQRYPVTAVAAQPAAT